MQQPTFHFTLTTIQAAANFVIENCGTKKIIFFEADMGAGKTTLINEICCVLQVQDVVSSPTFSIINEYALQKGDILYHMDLYRLKSYEECVQAGVDDALQSGRLCLVEWPQLVEPYYSSEAMHIHIKVAGNEQRMLKIIM